jgi:glycine oxidase
VQINEGVTVEDFDVRGNRVHRVITSQGGVEAGSYCVTTGAWTRFLLSRLGMQIPVRPVRGQMVLLRSARSPLERIINDGPRYLVPRPDGRTLVGSTEEDAGFDKSTTASGVAGLLEFALELAPALQAARLEQTWAGLRPGTHDGLPYLGRVGELENTFIAAGHFRSGLCLSPGNAVVMSRLIRGEPPLLDLAPFGLGRISR